MKVRVNVRLNPQFSKCLAIDLNRSMNLTMEDLKDDLIQSHTMPFDNGDMQDDTFYTVRQDAKVIKGILITDKPYARYQFFGISRSGKPLNYQTVHNPYARSHWLEPYSDGVFLEKRFNDNLSSKGGG